MWPHTILSIFMTVAIIALPTANASVKEFELSNGLKLIVQEDHRAPVAVVQIWYKVGSAHERRGITGVSHALEHMMFKGTEAYPDGQFSEIVAAKGGRENAFTSSDYTAYYQQWSSENVGLSFELEADRMNNLVFKEEEFLKEINVVLEERRLRTDDNPQGLAREANRALAFQESPYRHPVIGWESDIKGMRLDDLEQWYQQWYAPNNATVVVVGDVSSKAVHKLAQQHFGGLARETVPILRSANERVAQGTKRLIMTSDKVRVPLLLMSYKVPSLGSVSSSDEVDRADVYALDVLAEVLDGDNSARFARHLIRGKSLATYASIGYSPASLLDTLFSISAVPAEGITLDQLEVAITSELLEIIQSPPTQVEMQRVKSQVIASRVYAMDSMESQATIIGQLESVGLDWRLKDEYIGNITKVTANDLVAVVKKYIRQDALATTQLLPESSL
jgi:zinc protease